MRIPSVRFIKLTIVSAFFLHFASPLQAQQNQWQIGAIAAPSLANINFSGDKTRIENNNVYPVNYGLQVHYTTAKWTASAGVSNVTQGYKTGTTTNNSSQENSKGQPFRADILMLPLTFNYHIWKNRKHTFFGGVGFNIGYVYRQEIEFAEKIEFRTSSGQILTPEELGVEIRKGRFLEQKVYDDLYLGINAGLGWRYNFSKNWALQVRPNFLYQVGAAHPVPSFTDAQDDSKELTNPLYSINLDVGIFYQL